MEYTFPKDFYIKLDYFRVIFVQSGLKQKKDSVTILAAWKELAWILFDPQRAMVT